MTVVKEAKAWFDKASENDASLVFSQGDMNEHNIFYDKPTKTVSFIDFADAKYENAYDMFHRNLARLKWLDVDRLISEYKSLPREQPVIVESNKKISDMRQALRNFKWPTIEILNNPTHPGNKIRLEMIKDAIKKIALLYSDITNEHLATTTQIAFQQETCRQPKR